MRILLRNLRMWQVDPVGELTDALRLAKMSGVPDTLLCGPAFLAIVPDIRAEGYVCWPLP